MSMKTLDEIKKVKSSSKKMKGAAYIAYVKAKQTKPYVSPFSRTLGPRDTKSEGTERMLTKSERKHIEKLRRSKRDADYRKAQERKDVSNNDVEESIKCEGLQLDVYMNENGRYIAETIKSPRQNKKLVHVRADAKNKRVAELDRSSASIWKSGETYSEYKARTKK